MLKSGKISVEEAEEQLDALEAIGQERQLLVGAALASKGYFYSEAEAGLSAVAKQNNVQLLIEHAWWHLDTQMQQLDKLLQQELDALLISPVDSKNVVPAIRSANEKDIPVFTMDTTAEGGQIVAHIASDNEGGGEALALYLADLLDGKASIGIVDEIPKVTSTIERIKGFENTLAQFPEMKIAVKVDVPRTASSTELMESMLNEHPDINAIFGVTARVESGIMSAIQTMRREDIAVVCFDLLPQMMRSIEEEGPLKAVIKQCPREIGSMAMRTILKYLRGEAIFVPLKIELFTGVI